MFVRYVPYAGERVSRAWRDVLRAADRQGVEFSITEGHRQFARQAWFFMCFKTKRCNNGNLAARPSCSAPHIACGRKNHAIDVNQLDGGADRLVRWLRARGVNALTDCAAGACGEPWHIFVPENQLVALAKRIRKNQRAIERADRRQARRRSRKAK